MHEECFEPNQLLAEKCTTHTHRHVSAHIHTYDAWHTSHAHYTQHTYTHACIHAVMHQCIHIKAIVVCICTYIYIHTYRAQTTDMTCIRIYITYIACIHIVFIGFFSAEAPTCAQLPQNHSLCSGAPTVSPSGRWWYQPISAHIAVQQFSWLRGDCHCGILPRTTSGFPTCRIMQEASVGRRDFP